MYSAVGTVYFSLLAGCIMLQGCMLMHIYACTYVKCVDCACMVCVCVCVRACVRACVHVCVCVLATNNANGFVVPKICIYIANYSTHSVAIAHQLAVCHCKFLLKWLQ